MTSSLQPSTGSVNALLSGFTDIRTNRPDILAKSLQTVKDIIAASTAADRKAAIADDTTYATSGIAGPALGGLGVRGMPYGNADGYGWTINDSANVQSATAKNYFAYPRPFVVDKSIKPLVAGSGGSLPSGHTTKGFAESLYLAYIFPERYQEILTRASEYGEHRIVNGVHYPLDIVAGRMVAEWNTARLLSPSLSPSTSQAIANTAVSVRTAMIAAISKATPAGSEPNTIAEQAASGPTDRFSDPAANEADWERRMTFGLPSVGATDQPMAVPAEAPYLLATRLPYLSLDQIAEVLRTTALPSGVVMDNGNGWARLDLYRAAGGYGRFDTDVSITMDAARAADDRRPGAGFNAAATWSNDIGGVGRLIKDGSGVLTLSGDNTFAGIQLVAGGINLTGSNAFTGSTQVTGGTLSVTGPALTIAGDLAVGPLGVFQIGKARVAVEGAVTAQGSVVLTEAAEIDITRDGIVSGAVSGAGGLTKGGVGQLTLAAPNTYSGGTVLAAGALLLGDSAALGSGALSIATGATLGFSSNALSVANAITLNGSSTITVGSALTSESLLGTIADGSAPGAMSKTGSGTLILSGPNSYSGGTTLVDGTLELRGLGAAGAGAITFSAGAQTLQLDSAGSLANSLLGFAPGDTITLRAINPGTAMLSYANGVLGVTDGRSTSTLKLAAAPQGYGYVTSADPNGGLDLTLAPTTQANNQAPFALTDRSSLTSLTYLTQTSYPVTYATQGYTVGGLSGIDYNPTTKTFISQSDHGKDSQPRHFFSLQANFVAGQPGYGLSFTGATRLGPDDIESIRFDPSGNGIWITTEGTPPRIYHLASDGMWSQIKVPDNIATRAGSNASLEGSTFTLNGSYVVSMEAPLSGDTGNLTRITRFKPDSSVAAQYAYKLESGGVSEILSLSDTKFLIMERGFDGKPQTTPPVSVSHNSVRIYEIDTSAATDVQNIRNLSAGGPFTPVTKSLILDGASLASTLNTYETKIDNLEGMSFGPKLPDGHDSLVLVSDDNYNPTQGKTQFLVFKVNTPVPALQFWDGTSPMADGRIGGGNGTWSAGAAAEPWARADGTVNDAWNGGTAVFAGPSGTVSIDAGGGPVSAGKLDFQSDGYRIVGGPLTVGAGGLTVSVAGTAQASLGVALTGANAVTLAGPGTLVLSGASTYSGGTVLAAGALLLGDSAALGSGALSIATGATLGFSSNALSVANAITLNGSSTITVGSAVTSESLLGTIADGSAPGAMSKTGSGTLILSGPNSYSGGTTLVDGTLELRSLGAAGAGAIAFSAGAQTLQLDSAALGADAGHSFANTISGFGADGDVIDLRGIGEATSARYEAATGTLTLSAGSTLAATLHLSGGYDGIAFTAASDGQGGTRVTAYGDTTAPAAPTQLADAAVKGGSVGAASNTAGQSLTGLAEADSLVTVFDGTMRLGTAAADAAGTWSFGLGALAEGSHSLTATATDAAGNTGPASAALVFTVDTVAPQAPSLALAHDTGIVGDGITADAALAIPNAEPGATWAFRVDGGAPAAVYGPGALKDGAHTVSVTQTDAAGNVSAAGSLSFLLDSQAPVLQPVSRMQVGLVPAEGTVLAGATDATALHVVDARFGSNGAEFAVPAGGQTVVSGSHGTLSIAGDGSYRYVPAAYAADGDTFSIDVADAAGNVSRTSLHIATSSAIPQSAPSFTFALTEARFDFSHGHDLMTAPDGTVTDLTGARTITFTDGTVQEADGSPLVDDLYYVATNPDVWAAHVDPDQHYAQYGWREGRNPNAYFDTRAYLAQNPDVAAAGVNPLTHYDTYGRHEGRSPGPAFSAEAYLAVNPDVAAAGLDPLAHYLQYGRSEGRATVAGLTLTGDGDHLYGDFDASFYLAANPDVAAVARSSGVASDSFAFSHYLRYGAPEGRDPNPYFDTRFYLAHNPDVAASGMNPLLHYEQYGWREGRDPSAAFGTNTYLTAHPDVAAAQMDPLHHYLVNGFQDGRPIA